MGIGSGAAVTAPIFLPIIKIGIPVYRKTKMKKKKKPCRHCMMPHHCANIKISDSPESVHVVQSCFIVLRNYLE